MDNEYNGPKLLAEWNMDEEVMYKVKCAWNVILFFAHKLPKHNNQGLDDLIISLLQKQQLLPTSN